MSTSSRPQLIGISGTIASGKDTLANRLVADFGFNHASLGNMVREVAQRERGSIERPILKEVATKHRHDEGAGVFVTYALQKPLPLVVTGIRTIGEMKTLAEAGGIVIFVDAPLEVRYARMKSRVRDAEALLSLEGFIANEQAEWHTGDGDGDFNFPGIKAAADIVIENALNLEDFLSTAYSELNLK